MFTDYYDNEKRERRRKKGSGWERIDLLDRLGNYSKGYWKKPLFRILLLNKFESFVQYEAIDRRKVRNNSTAPSRRGIVSGIGTETVTAAILILHLRSTTTKTVISLRRTKFFTSFTPISHFFFPSCFVKKYLPPKIGLDSSLSPTSKLFNQGKNNPLFLLPLLLRSTLQIGMLCVCVCLCVCIYTFNLLH